MNPWRVSWGSAGAHRLHFENCWFHEFLCTCSGQSCSVALKSSVISLVLKIKSNIIQKSITGPFSVPPGSFPAILSMHQYSLLTLVLFTTLKVPEPFLLQGPSVQCALFCIFMLCFFFFWESLLFTRYLTDSYSLFKSHTSDYFPGETEGGLNEHPRKVTAISPFYVSCGAQGPNVNT